MGPIIAAVSAPAIAAPSWRAALGSGRGRLTAGLALAEFAAGMEALVVSAAMPRVLADLGGVAFYGTVFGGYMLAGLVSIPLAGRTADHLGPQRPFRRMTGWFAAGTVLCALAPSMPLLAAARVVQGYGGGAIYTIAYGAVAKAYPSEARPRLLALLSATWVVSGLIGPGLGAVVATTVGWRWAFVVVLPLVVLSLALSLPSLGRLPAVRDVDPLSPTWPMVLAVACGLGMTAGSAAAWWSAPVGVLALAGIGVALGRLLPPGWVRAAPGAAAAVTVSSLLYLGFFTADSFLTLLLTNVRGTSIAEAGVAVSLVSVSWFAGNWWQTRALTRHSAARLTLLGSVLFTAGTALTAGLLVGIPLVVGYAGWSLAGVGVGIAYPTVLLASMDYARRGDETRSLAARFVSGRVGMIVGTGLGGAAVAAAHAAGRPLAWGLSAVFALALAGGVASALASGRLRPV